MSLARSWACALVKPPVIWVLLLDGPCTTGAVMIVLSRKMASCACAGGAVGLACVNAYAAVVSLLHSAAPWSLKVMLTAIWPFWSVPTSAAVTLLASRASSIFQWYPVGYSDELANWVGSYRFSWSRRNCGSLGLGAPATAVAKCSFEVVPTVRLACSGPTPGSWMRIWSEPCAETAASETPRPLTRAVSRGIVLSRASVTVWPLGPLRQPALGGSFKPWHTSTTSSVPP